MQKVAADSRATTTRAELDADTMNEVEEGGAKRANVQTAQCKLSSLQPNNGIANYGGERGASNNEVCTIAILSVRRPRHCCGAGAPLLKSIRKVSAGGEPFNKLNGVQGRNIPKTLA